MNRSIKERRMRRAATLLTTLLLLSVLAPVWAQERPAAAKTPSATDMASSPGGTSPLDGQSGGAPEQCLQPESEPDISEEPASQPKSSDASATASSPDSLPSADLGGIQKPQPTDDLPSQGAAALEGLIAWMESDEPEYTLTGDVVWPGGGLPAVGEGIKTLYMGSHNILVPKGKLFAAVGNYRFIGDGGAPMFTIQTGGLLKLNMDVVLEVTDGCAVELEGDSPESPDQAGFSPEYGAVTAKGMDAVAVRSGGDLFLNMANIRTEGGAKAIEAAGDVRLYLSVTEGAITAGGMLTADASALSPVPEKARIIKRTARLYREAREFPLFCPAYGEGPILPDTLLYVLAAQEGEEASETYANLDVDWKNGGQDIAQPGIYQVTVTPRPPFEGVELACPDEKVTLTVMEEGRPYLWRAFRNIQTDTLELYGTVPNGWMGRVYCSEDSGESWTAWGEWTSIKNSGAIQLDRYMENGKTYWFQVDVDMGGRIMRTNLLEVVVGKDGLPQSGSLSGDRDDSRRGERPMRPSEDDGGGGSDPDGARPTESSDGAPVKPQALPAVDVASSQAQTPQSVSEKPDHGHDLACGPPVKPGEPQADGSGAADVSVLPHPQTQSDPDALKTLSIQDDTEGRGGNAAALLPIVALFCSAAVAGGGFYRWICRRKRRRRP